VQAPITEEEPMTARHISKPKGDHKSAITEHIAAIRTLGKQTIANIIEIGRRLTECKVIVGHRNFGNWLDREFGWAERTAQNFMRVYELSKSKSANFADLDLSISTLYLLAAPSTPEPVREEIIERAEAGEKITHKEVKQTIARARPARKGWSRKRFRRHRAKHNATAQREAAAQTQQDVGPDSAGGIKEKPTSLSPDIYFSATHEDRQHFLDAIGLDRLLAGMSATMLAELHRRLVAQYRDQKPETPLNPTQAALAQLAAEEAAKPVADDDLPSLRRTKH
jgi:hypothetical protein